MEKAISNNFVEIEKQLIRSNEKLRLSELLLRVSRNIAGLSNLKEILFAIIEETVTEIGADRGTLFLNDPLTGELYSRVAQGELTREIRILNTSGIAGAIFHSGKGEIIHDVQSDERFNSSIDEQTGYRTKNIICAPIRTVRNDIIGVIQILNKRKGRFTKHDLNTVSAITEQAAMTLQNAQGLEQMAKARAKEMEFLDVVSDVTAEIELGALLQRVMIEATRMLNADRATLFLNDPRTDELFSRVAMGEGMGEIRLPNTAGIAGSVFTSGKTMNIPYAYADLRFNPAFDKQTGYFTRSILCVPVTNKNGKVIAKAHNLVETRNDATSHAEKLVIEKALKITGSRYLNNYDIWVTLEPCIMCASIIKQTRIRRLYYGAEDKKGGAIDNGIKMFSNCTSKAKLEVYSGFSANKSEKLIKEFFKEIR